MYNRAVRFSRLRRLGRPPLRLNEGYFWMRLGLSRRRVTTALYDHDYPNCLELNKLSFNCIRFIVVFFLATWEEFLCGNVTFRRGQSVWYRGKWMEDDGMDDQLHLTVATSFLTGSRRKKKLVLIWKRPQNQRGTRLWIRELLGK